MDKLIERFPDQLEEALQIGRAAELKKHEREIRHIHVAGLGGSGIGAEFVRNYIAGECKQPFTISKDYMIPAAVGPHTLAIASSYSGNTEETLTSFDEMKEAGAMRLVISGGGKLIERAKEEGLNYIQVPGDWPSPRACLGYSVVAQLYALHKLELIGDGFVKGVEKAVERIRRDEEDIRARAEMVADFIHGKTAVIYAADRLAPVALRFRQQINENSKALCWHHILPEMNHNELVGWRDKRDDLAVLALRSKRDYPRNQVRFDIVKEIVSERSGSWIELYSKGEDHIEESMYVVHLTDWISWYLAQKRGVDAMEVKVIDYLKGELAKQ